MLSGAEVEDVMLAREFRKVIKPCVNGNKYIKRLFIFYWSCWFSKTALDLGMLMLFSVLEN